MEQSIELQQQALYMLQNHLSSFKNFLKDNLQQYHNIVENLRQEGLSNEVYTTYSGSYFERDRQYIQSLIEHIETNDEPYIVKNLEETGVNKDVARRGLDF